MEFTQPAAYTEVEISFGGDQGKPMYNILIIDDDRDARYSMEIIVRQVDGTPILAENGEQALKLLADQTPDLIMMDLMMPGLTGFELLRILQADERLRSIPVMVTSAMVSADPDQFKLPGVVDVVPKAGLPLKTAIERVRKVLEGKHNASRRKLPTMEPRTYLYE